MNAVLVVEHPSGGRSRAEIRQSPFTIGRQTDNELVLRDSRVSRRHARIVRDNGHFVLEDLESSHGLFVNGARAARRELAPGDRIDFGYEDGYRLTFQLEDAGLERLMDQVKLEPANLAGAVPGGAHHLARLRALVEVARTLQSSLGIQEVLASVVDAALNITGMERGFLLLKRANGELAADVARDCERRALPPAELRVPMGIIRRALESRRELLTMTFDPYSDIDVSATVAQLELRAVICVPLVRLRADEPGSTDLLAAAENTAGVIYLDSRASMHDLSGGNRELLQTLALEASTVLENARLLEEDRTRRKLQEEMGIARTIQQNLLPRELPREGWFRAFGSSLPAAQVGGDYFDARPSPHGWTLVVADVSGKGVSSALLASLLQGAFLAGGPIVELLRRVNAFLLERTQGEKYATIFYAHLLPDGLLEYANTGIGPPLLVRAASREFETLDSTAMPLGMLEEAEFDVAHARLEPGDLVLAYSDGVEDARSGDGEPFGKKRVRELLERLDALDPLAVHDSLRRAVLEHARGAEPADDITIVAFGYHP